MSQQLIATELLNTLRRLDQYASVPRDLCFDDADLSTVVFDESGRPPTPATIFEPAREYLGSAVERSGFDTETDVLKLTSQLVEQDHALIDDGYESIKAVMPLVCRKCLEPGCTWNVKKILSSLANLAEHQRDEELQSCVRVTRAFWFRSGQMHAEANEIWQELRPLQKSDNGQSEYAVLAFVINAARGFWELLDNQDDNRLDEIRRLLHVVIESSDVESDALPADRRDDRPILNSLCDDISSLTSVSNRIRRTEEPERAFQFADYIVVVCVMELAAGADHPFTISVLNQLIRFVQDEGAHELAVRLSEYAVAIRERELGPNSQLLATSLNNMGLSLASLDRFDEAEGALKRAIAISPEFANPLYWLARLYQNRAMPDDEQREANAWHEYLNLGGTTRERMQEARQRIIELQRPEGRL